MSTHNDSRSDLAIIVFWLLFYAALIYAMCSS